MEANFEAIFCGLDLPLALHFQDYLGQSVKFEFPFSYDYSEAFTCAGDSVPYLRLLQRVAGSQRKRRRLMSSSNLSPVRNMHDRPLPCPYCAWASRASPFPFENSRKVWNCYIKSYRRRTKKFPPNRAL